MDNLLRSSIARRLGASLGVVVSEAAQLWEEYASLADQEAILLDYLSTSRVMVFTQEALNKLAWDILVNEKRTREVARKLKELGEEVKGE